MRLPKPRDMGTKYQVGGGIYEKLLVINDAEFDNLSVYDLVDAVLDHKSIHYRNNSIAVNGVLRRFARPVAGVAEIREPIERAVFIPADVITAGDVFEATRSYTNPNFTTGDYRRADITRSSLLRKGVSIKALGALVLPDYCKEFGIDQLQYPDAIMEIDQEQIYGAYSLTGEVVADYRYVIK